MSYQTSLNGSANGSAAGVPKSPAKAVFGNAAEIVHDITELAELQAKLLVSDVGSVKQRVAIPAGALVVSLVMLLGLVPVALLGLAEFFMEWAELSRASGLLAAAGCGAAFTLIVMAVAWSRLKGCMAEFENSRRELNNNIAWIKSTLSSGMKSPTPSAVDHNYQ